MTGAIKPRSGCGESAGREKRVGALASRLINRSDIFTNDQLTRIEAILAETTPQEGGE